MTQQLIQEIQEYKQEHLCEEIEAIRDAYFAARDAANKYAADFFENPPDKWLGAYDCNPAALRRRLKESYDKFWYAKREYEDTNEEWKRLKDKMCMFDKTYEELKNKADEAHVKWVELHDAVTGLEDKAEDD